MKKVFYFIAVIALISLSSCSTECTCTTSATGEGSEFFPETTNVFTADSECSEGNSTTTVEDLTVTTVCK